MLTVTLNAALDITYVVPGFRLGASHTVSTVTSQAGGKGLNVARVLATLGHDVTVTGLLAGPTGGEIREDIARTSLTDAFITVEGDSRRTVTIVDDGTATALNEPGDRLRVADWASVEEHLAGTFAGHSVVVASGSLPRIAPPDAYARLVELAHRAGARIIVDTTGPALLAAATAGADLVKPNAEELRATTGRLTVEEGADALLELGAGAVAASLGPGGVYYSSRAEALYARPPRDVVGNPTGAGDAMVAALAAGLEAGSPVEESVARAVALSAAAVSHPLAGHVSPALYEEFLQFVTIERGAR